MKCNFCKKEQQYPFKHFSECKKAKEAYKKARIATERLLESGKICYHAGCKKKPTVHYCRKCFESVCKEHSEIKWVGNLTKTLEYCKCGKEEED